MSAVLTNSIHTEGKSAMSTARKTKLALGLMQASALVTVLMLASPAQAQITFNYTYTDPAGVGFNAAGQLGTDRKAALVATGQLITDLFPNYTATIDMSVNGAETNNSTLAAAGSNYNSAAASTCQAGFNEGDVGIKVFGGIDPSPNPDGTITVNFEDHVWDLDDNIDPAQMDFKSTMLHELLHAMGFAHSVTQAGATGCNQVAPTPGGWQPYDQHLGDTTTPFINSVSFVINTAAWQSKVTGGTGNAGVLWRGTNALAANGGQGVPLFSPAVYSDGSSISHLDDDFYPANLLMKSATGAGPGARTLVPIEVGIMKDIGYGNTVPVELESFSID